MQFTETRLVDAYAWLCRSRRHHPPNADIWHLRFHWRTERRRLLKALRHGTYRFEPVRRCQTADGDLLHLWSSRDALVLKALTVLVLRAGPLQPTRDLFGRPV